MTARSVLGALLLLAGAAACGGGDGEPGGDAGSRLDAGPALTQLEAQWDQQAEIVCECWSELGHASEAECLASEGYADDRECVREVVATEGEAIEPELACELEVESHFTQCIEPLACPELESGSCNDTWQDGVAACREERTDAELDAIEALDACFG